MARRGRRSRFLLATAMALACSGGGGGPAPSDESPQAVTQMDVTGTVAVVGNTPFEKVVIRPDDSAAPAVEVQGNYEQELRSLSGAKVVASGSASGSGVLNVASYEILEIAGHRPVVGILEVSEAEVAVRSLENATARTYIYGVPEELRRLPGAKVWVILDQRKGVQAYGVVRKP